MVMDDLLRSLTQGQVPPLSSGGLNMNALKVNPVPYAQPPAGQMGPMMSQAMAMAGPAPQNQPPPPPPMMGVPNHPGLPGGAPRPQIPGLPMRDPMDIIRMIRGGGFGGMGMR